MAEYGANGEALELDLLPPAHDPGLLLRDTHGLHVLYGDRRSHDERTRSLGDVLRVGDVVSVSVADEKGVGTGEILPRDPDRVHAGRSLVIRIQQDYLIAVGHLPCSRRPSTALRPPKRCGALDRRRRQG